MRYGWRATIYTLADSLSSVAIVPPKYKEAKLAKDGGEKAAKRHQRRKGEEAIAIAIAKRSKEKATTTTTRIGPTAVLHWEPSANCVTRFDGQPAHIHALLTGRLSEWAFAEAELRREWRRQRAMGKSECECERARIWQLQWGENALSRKCHL